MKLVKSLLTKARERNMLYGAVVREYIPVFHDKYMSKNKDLKIIEDLFVEHFKHQLETQNGIPIKFHKLFNETMYLPENFHNGDLSFEKNGRKVGMKITMNGQGFLGNLSNTYIVELVTDKYVYLKNIEYNIVTLKSHEELDTIQSMGGLHQTS